MSGPGGYPVQKTPGSAYPQQQGYPQQQPSAHQQEQPPAYQPQGYPQQQPQGYPQQNPAYPQQMGYPQQQHPPFQPPVSSIFCVIVYSLSTCFYENIGWYVITNCVARSILSHGIRGPIC
ncbi:PREDICTED: annexin A7-like [Amphimedon queenslandica]|uniref:Uncharacterized protein n=1 Tax=Amphimedon queenslandica TaxID=400682 RepID=A0AAN0K3J7_AMPQE|nr:PREDICTED: annexin A7-like [Amphimedon queenslandica]|eukprot:XP_019864096.1 PREDICTED: annexin A7-like [Amphimedon queenslandica]